MKLKYLKTISAWSVMMASHPSIAVDSLPGVDLWLPKSYQSHYVKLVETAKKIQLEPACWKLLNGRLVEGKSTLENPVFYFRCRDENRKSFSYEVDMKTMAIVNLDLERERVNAERVAVQQAKASASGESKKQEAANWKLCRKAIEEKISSFNEAKITNQEQPQAKRIGRSKMQFIADVDALSLTNKTLRYSAECNILSAKSITVTISRRKN